MRRTPTSAVWQAFSEELTQLAGTMSHAHYTTIGGWTDTYLPKGELERCLATRIEERAEISRRASLVLHLAMEAVRYDGHGTPTVDRAMWELVLSQFKALQRATTITTLLKAALSHIAEQPCENFDPHGDCFTPENAPRLKTLGLFGNECWPCFAKRHTREPYRYFTDQRREELNAIDRRAFEVIPHPAEVDDQVTVEEWHKQRAWGFAAHLVGDYNLPEALIEEITERTAHALAEACALDRHRKDSGRPPSLSPTTRKEPAP